MAVPMKTIPGYENTKPGIQVGDKLPLRGGKFSDDDILFLRQMGIEWVMVEGPDGEVGVNDYKDLVRGVENKGLKVYRLSNHYFHNMDVITLNLEGRDKRLEGYLNYIRAMGAAGVRYSTYAHMANGIWRSGETKPIRGGHFGHGWDKDSPDSRGRWIGTYYGSGLSHGRIYTEDELWENYAYFITRVAKVAEDSGVFIGMHPDDPPVYTLAGVPRKIFGTFEGYKKALEIADSPNIGVCLCCGCWLQGGDMMGADVYEAARYFGQMGKLFKLHVRNVTNPMDQPGGFAETYPNDGYGDVPKIVRTLSEVGFDGCIMNDHLAPMVGGEYTSAAFQTAYLLGLVDAANRGA
ncbi:MAG: mannonate dehydratase [Oscillospiraceae bacterium]|nr:mannonate dehydratase [Oscillospiraceae bacterium]